MTNFGNLEYDIEEARHYGITVSEYIDYKKDMEFYYGFK
jgi:hypothetical protein